MQRPNSNHSVFIIPAFFRRPVFWAPILFVFVGFLIYSNSFQVSFRFDDSTFIADRMQVRDIGRVWRVGEALDYGMVGINEGIISTAEAPFGGMKQSGNGWREPGTEALDGYSDLKDVYISIDPEAL